MAERQNWPAWRYGPNGEAQIFASAGDVPEGWVKHPSKLPPASEQLPEGAGSQLESLRACEEENVRLRKENDAGKDDFLKLAAAVHEVETLRMAEEKWIDAREQMRGEISQLREENARLRAENTRLQEKAAIVPPLPQREQPEQSVRRPRKLGKGVPGTPFTPQDETITVDEGRTERLKVLREAGITISDDATDGDIEEALDWLEKQPKKG
jgi:small-conductance mechanosensitive channel